MSEITKYLEVATVPLDKWFTYPGTTWRLQLRYMDGGQAQELRKRCELMEDLAAEGGTPVDPTQAGKETLMTIVRDWKGLKVKHLPQLLRVKPDIKKEDPDKEIPFSHGVLFDLCDKANGFEAWLTRHSMSITDFQTIAFEGDLGNLPGGPSTSSPGPVEDASKGSSKEEKSGAGKGASA